MNDDKNKEKPGVELLIFLMFLVSAVMFSSVFLIVKHKDYFGKILLGE